MEVKNPLFSDDTPAATPSVNQTVSGGVVSALPNGHRTDDDDAAQ